VKAPAWIVTALSPTVLCSAYRIGFTYLWDQAATCRKFAERADDLLVKGELLALASVCEAIADNIDDHLTEEEERAPPDRLPRLS
jgi:hypothetical protein